MAGTASVSGIISGLKTDDIIAKLMELANAPVKRLEARKTALSAKITAWQEMNTRILALKTKASALASPLTFQTKDLTTSSSDILTGTASSTAQAGTYFIKVNATAKTSQLKTQGFADINSTTIGTGTITVGAGAAGRTTANLLAGTVESVTLAANTTLTAGSQTLVIDAVGTSAAREMTATYAGADETAARAQDAGAAGTITINGVEFAFDDSDTVGEVVDAINARTSDTGVVATITGSADDWHVTLTQQTHGTNKAIVYAETAGILNGGSGNDYTVVGTDASGHIGSLLFNSGVGDTLQSANGDIIVLNGEATTGTKENAFEIVGANSITINSTNNTLAGLRDAINAASAGVTASIINDGSATAPYRLIITSNIGGTAGQITLNANGLSGGMTPTFSTMQTAQDASLTLGEGDGAITITKGSNTITDLISGVTLNLKSADTDKTVTVDIKSNSSAAKQAIRDFVEQYNNLIDYIGPQFQYNATTNTAGTLFADSRLRSILSDLRSKISNPISGLDQTIKVMSQIGITSTTNDKLQINETDLDDALANNLSSVKKLFAKVGEASNGSVVYVASMYKTKPSSSAGYAINITQAATQAYVTAGAQQDSPLAQDETLTINGVAISLSSGMTQTQVISRINEYTSQTGITASSTSSRLTLRKSFYGSAQRVTVVSSVSVTQNPGANSGMGNISVTEAGPQGESGNGTGSAGLDVQGTMNGEAATGSGQYLTGNSGNSNTEGLKIRVTATVAGSYGYLVFTRGIGGLLTDYADDLTAMATGSIAAARTNLEEQIGDIDDEIATLHKRLAVQEERLYTQFNAMENALNRLQSQANFLTQQFSQ